MEISEPAIKRNNSNSTHFSLVLFTKANKLGLVVILTGGPLGPLSPLSQAHWLWARGHFKHREIRIRHNHTQTMQGHEMYGKACSLETYPFIRQRRLWNKKHKILSHLLHMVYLYPISRYRKEDIKENQSKLSFFRGLELQTPAPQTPN